MAILEENVKRYLSDLRPERSELMADMEAVAARDSVPIVHWEAGRFLVDRVERVEGDARETIPGLSGPFGLLFVDASKGEYTRYIELMEPLLAERCVLVVDNLLMEGEVAPPEGADTQWNPDSLNAARVLNSNLLGSERWLACVLPIGEKIGFGARRD